MTRAEIRCAHGGLVVVRATPGKEQHPLAPESHRGRRQWMLAVEQSGTALVVAMSNADLVRLHEAIGKMLEGE